MVDTRLERVNIRPGRLLLGLARVDILGWRELILGLGRLILGLAMVDTRLERVNIRPGKVDTRPGKG